MKGKDSEVQKEELVTSLAVQQLRICLPVQGIQAPRARAPQEKQRNHRNEKPTHCN